MAVAVREQPKPAGLYLGEQAHLNVILTATHVSHQGDGKQLSDVINSPAS